MQSTQISQNNFEKKKKLGGPTLPDFKVYYKIIVTTTLLQWHKNRHINHWNKIESPERVHIYPQFIFDKDMKVFQWRSVFFTGGTIRCPSVKKEKGGGVVGRKRERGEEGACGEKRRSSFVIPCDNPKIGMNWIIDLNVKAKIAKLIKKKHSRKFL